MKSIIARLRNSFNASVAEVAANDNTGRAEIGFALVGNDIPVINAKVDKVMNMVEDMGLAEIIDSELEIIHL